ncbi:hypothetical protein [Virgibacillus sp. DJP39]|uniref:hypothetical protein n=1 Tax=Virgibacillus sp. DJP39 TaxID=3409790 RepID=UPI003BB530C2
MATGISLFLHGLKKKSVMSIFFGGNALLATVRYFIGWDFLPFVPPISMAFAYSVREKLEPT